MCRIIISSPATSSPSGQQQLIQAGGSFARRTGEQGQSMVEFSLLLLPFLFMMIGIIEISYAWSAKQAVTNAAREGTRVLLLPYGIDQNCPDIDCSSAEGVQNAALQTVRKFLQTSGIKAEEPLTQISLVRQRIETNGTITSEPLFGDIKSGEWVGVEIRYQYASVIQGFLSADTGTITLRGMSVMRHE